jgi:tetratricopeptide (TPR) repeat protein
LRITTKWIRRNWQRLLFTAIAAVASGLILKGGLPLLLEISDQLASVISALVVLGIVSAGAARRSLGPPQTTPTSAESGVAGSSRYRIKYLREPTPANWVNRDQAISTLNTVLTDQFATMRSSGRLPDRALIIAIAGMAGVGKTALARHWAHQIKEQFPDGQVSIDLGGDSDGSRPADPSDVLRAWIRDLKPDTILPDSKSELAAVFQDLLATRRVLLLLDNASSAEQVRPLLPSVGPACAIITSRAPLDGLTGVEVAVLESLSALSPRDAQRMLTMIIGKAAADRPELVVKLAEYCGNLPLALRVVAASIATRSSSGHSLPDLVAAFKIEESRLSLMKSASTDNKSNVKVAFSYSYRALSISARRAFRLLGLHLNAGSTIDSYVMAALLGKTADEAAALLEHLEHRGLVMVLTDGPSLAERAGDEPELPCLTYRYRVHDLLRLYASDLMRRRRHRWERAAALRRLTTAYYGCVNYAFNKQNKGNPMVDAEYLARWSVDRAGPASVDLAGSPTEWFERERPNLLAAVQVASLTKPGSTRTAKLASSMFYFLEIGGHMTDWEEVEQVAEQNSRNRHDMARSLRNRGRIALVRVLDAQDRIRTGTPRVVNQAACRAAIALFEPSLDLYRREYRRYGQRRDRAGEMTVLREMGDAYRLEIDPAAPNATLIASAIAKYNEATVLCEELKTENGLNSLRLALGIAHILGDPVDHSGRAEELFTQSHQFAAGLDNGTVRHGRLAGYSSLRLGELRRQQGRLPEAIRFYRAAVTMFRTHVARDHVSRARALALLGRSLGEYQSQAGSRQDAATPLREALDIFTARGEAHHDESDVLLAWLNRYGA